MCLVNLEGIAERTAKRDITPSGLCRAPIVLRGVNFTLCTPQWFALAFHTAIPFPLRVTPFSHTFKAVYTRIFSAGRLVRPQEPVRCLPHFSNVGGLARQNPNNAYLIGRAVVCYFFRCDLPKFFRWFRVRYFFANSIFPDARFIA